MKISEMFRGKFLKGDDLKGTPTVKIARIVSEIVGQNNEEKPIIYFEGLQKGMVLNRTNAEVLEMLYGDESDDWVGHKITLYSTPVSFQGKTTNACRMRAPKVAKAVVEELNDELPDELLPEY
jgi:hypothetical protein